MITEPDLIIRLVVAAVLGGIIGLEREWHEKPAGFRTHILVCIGAAIFVIVTQAVALNSGDSVARVIAGVATGIGFLGAGTIFMRENRVTGLTTAADLWGVTWVGIAAGLGYYLFAATATAIIWVVLAVAGMIDKFVGKERAQKQAVQSAIDTFNVSEKAGKRK